MSAPAPTDLVAGRLRDRVAIVTGSGTNCAVPGIGQAIATLFAAAGARVAVLDTDQEAMASTVAAVDALGAETLGVVADVRSDADCRRAVADVLDRWGQLDALVNNVGIGGPPHSMTELNDADWTRVLDVNAGGVLRMTRHAVPVMRSGSAVVNLSSLAASRPRSATAYAASKSAVEALTRATASQYGARGIRANAICPGAMWTGMVARSFTDPEAAAHARRARQASGVLDSEGTAWDAAYAALFLAGPDSAWITGQVLHVDGGADLR